MSTEFSHEFNSLLRGELSAVETYDLALKRDFDGHALESLNTCRASHVHRVEVLTQCVLDTEGEPTKDSGIWGQFNSMVQGGAGSAQDTLRALEALEAERLVQYESQREIAPPMVRDIIVSELLPTQHQTHLIVSTMYRDTTETNAA